VNCVRFSPNGSKFLTVGSDKKGFIFNGKTGEKLGDLSGEDGHKGSIYAACWSSDGEQVRPFTLFWYMLSIFCLFLDQNILGLIFRILLLIITQQDLCAGSHSVSRQNC
jgi:hypothetical protein